MRGFLWPTEFLVFSDFLAADPHAHGALQLSVGIDGSPRVRLDGTWHRARGVLIDTDVAHAFDCDGQSTAIGWIEGESLVQRQLRDRVLEGRPYALLMSRCATTSRTGSVPRSARRPTARRRISDGAMRSAGSRST